MHSCSGELFWYLQEERPEQGHLDFRRAMLDCLLWIIGCKMPAPFPTLLLGMLEKRSTPYCSDLNTWLFIPCFGGIKWPVHLFCLVLHSCICYRLESKWLSNNLILSLPYLHENLDDPKALSLIYSFWFLSIIIHWLSCNEKYISIKTEARASSFWDLAKLASMRICFGPVEVQ